jgi:hypothetical protein
MITDQAAGPRRLQDVALLLPVPLWFGGWAVGRICERSDPFGMAVIAIFGWILAAGVAVLHQPSRLRSPGIQASVLITLTLAFSAAVAASQVGLGTLWWQASLALIPALTAAWALRNDWTQERVLPVAVILCTVTLGLSALGQAWSEGIAFRQQRWWGLGNVNTCQALLLPWLMAGIFGCRGHTRIIAAIGMAGITAVALATGRRSFAIMLAGGLALALSAGIPWPRWRNGCFLALVVGIICAPLLVASGWLETSGDLLRDTMWQSSWAEWTTSWLHGLNPSGAVALSNGESQPARWMQATTLWTHHAHSQILEWLLRGGVVLATVGMGWLGLLGWQVSRIPDLTLRRAAAALWGCMVAGMALDPAWSEPLCLVSIGFAMALVAPPPSAAAPIRRLTSWSYGGIAILALITLTWTCKQLVPAALLDPQANQAAMVRAASDSPDPVTTVHVLGGIRNSFFASPPGDPVFFLGGMETIEQQTGQTGLFLPTVRSAAAVRGDFLLYRTTVATLAHQQPFNAEYHLALVNILHGRLPFDLQSDVRKRCLIYSQQVSPDMPITLDGSIEGFAELQACLIAGRTPQPTELQALFAGAGRVPQVIATCYQLVAKDPRVDPANFARPNAWARWAIQQSTLPRVGASQRESDLRLAWQLRN